MEIKSESAPEAPSKKPLMAHLPQARRSQPSPRPRPLQERGSLSKQQRRLQFVSTVIVSGAGEAYFLQVPSAPDMSAVYLCLAKTNGINSGEGIIHTVTGGEAEAFLTPCIYKSSSVFLTSSACTSIQTPLQKESAAK